MQKSTRPKNQENPYHPTPAESTQPLPPDSCGNSAESIERFDFLVEAGIGEFTLRYLRITSVSANKQRFEMATTIPPIVRFMILCDDWINHRHRRNRIDILGLQSSIISLENPPFPLLHSELCVLLILTEGHGASDWKISFVFEGETVFETSPIPIAFSNDPLETIR